MEGCNEEVNERRIECIYLSHELDQEQSQQDQVLPTNGTMVFAGYLYPKARLGDSQGLLCGVSNGDLPLPGQAQQNPMQRFGSNRQERKIVVVKQFF